VRASFFLASALAVIVIWHVHAYPQSDTRTQSNVIIAAERQWTKAAVDHDIADFAKYMSDDYVLIAVNASPGKQPQFDVRTKSSWVEAVRSGHEKYDSVEIHDLKVIFNGDLATVTGAYSQQGTNDGKDISATGLYVDTWAKRNGQWQLINSTFP
jgi:ketosteroid isomerase-like protein